MTGLPWAHDPGGRRQAQHGLHGGSWPRTLAGKRALHFTALTIMITIFMIHSLCTQGGHRQPCCWVQLQPPVQTCWWVLLISRQDHSSISGLFWITTVTSIYYSCLQVGSWGGPVPAPPSPTSLTAWTRSLLCSQ